MNEKINIRIRLYATLRKFAPTDGDEMEIETGSAVSDLLNRLGVPYSEAKLIFINSKKGALESILHSGDRLGIFPPVGGG